MELINGLGRIQGSEFRPVAVGSVETRGPDGAKKIHITATERTHARDKAKAVIKDKSGVEKSPQDLGRLNPWIEAAQRDELVERAIGYLNRPEITWNDFYRAVEVVKSDVGSRITEERWASQAQLERFRRTANSYAILGYAARHGRDRFDPPANPMAFAEARQLVFGIVRKWIEGKVE